MSKSSLLSERLLCPNCVARMRFEIVADYRESWDDEEARIGGADHYAIVKCGGCSRTYFSHASMFSEDYEDYVVPLTGKTVRRPQIREFVYPKTSERRKPSWYNWKFEMSNPDISNTLKEIYSAIDNDIFVLAAIGIRTVFDQLAVELGADPRSSFEGKAEHLRSSSSISGAEKGFILVLTDAGSSAAHRGWRPDNNGLHTMLEILESTIHRTKVLGAKVDALKRTIPKRD